MESLGGLRCCGTWISVADRERLGIALKTGKPWHAVSQETGIPYTTVKKHARLMGYQPNRRIADI
jgi:uncharacterized protein YerC